MSALRQKETFVKSQRQQTYPSKSIDDGESDHDGPDPCLDRICTEAVNEP